MVYLYFVLCALAIMYAGARLSRYGDCIAEKTGLGRTWIGVVLLATVTSLPELFTGLSAVVINDLPDIAVGSVAGSCMFNVVIIAILDFFSRDKPISARVDVGHVLSASFGVLLISLFALDLFAGAPISVGPLDMLSVLIVVVYLFAMRLVFTYEKRRIEQLSMAMAEELQYESITLRHAVLLFSGFSVVIITAALFLPGLGEQIAEQTGLGNTFVGNFLIAIVTSLPELVVCFAAARMAAFDLAVGNVLGSNLFNVLVLAIADFAYWRAPLLAVADRSHQLAAVAAMAMTAVTVIGLTYRAQKKAYVAWDSFSILALYLLALCLIYAAR